MLLSPISIDCIRCRIARNVMYWKSTFAKLLLHIYNAANIKGTTKNIFHQDQPATTAGIFCDNCV